jgi:AcrR family transcriptional regulator
MANPDRCIDSKILDIARKEFLSKPYDGVSLREVCSKAGVTTGAFYNRYSNKEELFDALVAPTLALVEEYSNQTETASYTRLDEDDLRKIWELTPENQRNIINVFYDNYDGFRLLLNHAEGTKYANFLHDFVSEATSRSLRFIREAYKRGIVPFVIEEEELHMLLTAYWSTMFEPVIHGLPREKALQHSEVVAKLFNWTAVLGF